MNQTVHQLLQLILQGFAWVLHTTEALWNWSWLQIAAVFKTPWGDLPGWKLAVAVVVFGALAALLVLMIKRGLQAFNAIATAFLTMAIAMFGVLSFVVIAGLFSRGFQWVVASVPDTF